MHTQLDEVFSMTVQQTACCAMECDSAVQQRQTQQQLFMARQLACVLGSSLT